MENVELSVVAFERDGYWCAQGLQYDIAAQARSVPDLRRAFERAVLGHILVSEELGLEPFAGLGQAPRQYWEIFNKAELEMKVTRKRPPIRTQHRLVEVPSLTFGLPGAFDTDLAFA